MADTVVEAAILALVAPTLVPTVEHCRGAHSAFAVLAVEAVTIASTGATGNHALSCGGITIASGTFRVAAATIGCGIRQDGAGIDLVGVFAVVATRRRGERNRDEENEMQARHGTVSRNSVGTGLPGAPAAESRDGTERPETRATRDEGREPGDLRFGRAWIRDAASAASGAVFAQPRSRPRPVEAMMNRIGGAAIALVFSFFSNAAAEPPAKRRANDLEPARLAMALAKIQTDLAALRGGLEAAPFAENGDAARRHLLKQVAAIDSRLHRFGSAAGHAAGRVDSKAPMPSAPTPMVRTDFDRLRRQVGEAPFADGRFDAIRIAAARHRFDVDQVKMLLEQFPFSREQLDAAHVIVPCLIDDGRAFELLEVFQFSSDKDEMRKILAAGAEAAAE